jgi:hypothetical protein
LFVKPDDEVKTSVMALTHSHNLIRMTKPSRPDVMFFVTRRVVFESRDELPIEIGEVFHAFILPKKKASVRGPCASL